MHHDRVIFAHSPQYLERTSTTDHEVLSDYLEPVHSRVRFENLPVMGPAQTHAAAKKRKLSPKHWSGSEWPRKRMAHVQVRSGVELSIAAQRVRFFLCIRQC